jgi:hypothetical protein
VEVGLDPTDVDDRDLRVVVLRVLSVDRRLIRKEVEPRSISSWR